MLAPVTEADFGEEALLRVNLAARERWPALRRRARGAQRAADRLPRQRRAGRGRRSRRRRGAAPPARVPALARARRRSGWRRATAARLEPGLSPRIAGGILAPRDGQADPRAIVRALAARRRRDRARRRGRGDRARPRWRDRRAHRRPGRSPCEQRGGGGRARGARRWRPTGAGPPVRPVKGQILELRARGGAAEPLRAHRAHAALLPRRARRRPRGARRARWRSRASTRPSRPTASTACSRRPGRCCPEVGELELVRARGAGCGPALRTTRPLIGRGRARRAVIWATGHWRNGVLLAPLTGEVVADLLAGGRCRRGWPRSPRRASPRCAHEDGDR